MGGGSSTQKSEPWDIQVPYLKKGFAGADQLLQSQLPNYYQGGSVAGFDPAQQIAQQAKKFYRVLLGVATLKGKNAEGKKAVAENVPFIMRLRGNSLNPINEYLESFKKVGNVHDYVTNWTIKEGEGGNVDYWIALPEIGKASPIMENPTEYETLKGLMEWRQEYNDDIMSKWRKKNGMNVSKTLEAEAIEVAAVVIEPEMDEKIPF